MSIIEKAMNKLNGPRVQRRGAESNDRKVVEHPAAGQHPHDSAPTARNQPPTTPAPRRESARQLPMARLRPDGLIPSHALAPQVAEEYRRIKRPLLANAFGKGAVQVERGHLIMVTSSVPREGKTFTAINLALSVALERNYTVLLIDADLTKRQITHSYDLEQATGLTDLLSDDRLDIRDVVFRTDVPDLRILPAGAWHTFRAELLASEGMERLLTELAEHYSDRVIVMDAPPILATTDPQVLAAMVGQIVVVVEAGRTPQHVVKDAVSQLDTSKAVNLVLNKSQYTLGGGYYGHYYGGYYGYGYGAEES